MTTRLSSALGTGFRRFAAAVPGNPALVIKGRTLSYGECDDVARRWAARITEASGGRVSRVGVFGYRSEASYLGVLAALYSGAAFVPLNPRFPVARTRAMLERADPEAIIVDDSSAAQLPQLLAGLARPPIVLNLSSLRLELAGIRVLGKSDLDSVVPLPAALDAEPADLAYLLFTSGSTGVPKGVPITHGNVNSFLTFNQERYGIVPSDRFSQTFDQTFDLSVFDLFMAWEHGAAVCVMDPLELVSPFAYLERNQVSVWFSVPSVAAVLRKRGVLRPGSMPTLRWSLFCGEPLPRATAEAWHSAAPGSVLENLYGPTELTISCAVHRWNPDTSPALCVHGNVPIGQVYPALSQLIVDERLAAVDKDEPGELCIAGPQTTPGYWRAPELSAERFFDKDGRRYYRTGDLVRRVGDELVYLGRNDEQVKVGGFRVEVGEIEAILRQAGAVEAVCLVWPVATELTAVVSGTARTPDELLKEASAQLPDYMMPREVREIDQMPLNSNGKIDRNALREWLGSTERNHADDASADLPGTVDRIDQVIAFALGIPLGQVHDALEFRSIRQWDSLGHVELMVALESAFGLRADSDATLDLRSVAAIRSFVRDGGAPYAARPRSAADVRRGLDGVVFDRTALTYIDGVAGVLEYRGYSIHDLAEYASYQDVAHLLLYGEFPAPGNRAEFAERLADARTLPTPILDLLHSLRHAHPMDALLAALPALHAYGPVRPGGHDESYEAARAVGVRLISAVPMMVAAHHSYRSGREFAVPPADLSHAEAFLTALLGSEPSRTAVRLIDRDLVIHADHGSNASAFVARVVTGCRAGMSASITAAIAAFGGSVHGGAAERAVSLVDQVGTPHRAPGYVMESMRRNEPVMGFGHRVYRTEDPRAKHLRASVVELSQEHEDDSGLRILDAVVEAMGPYSRHGLAPNVDLYSGLAYRLLDIPDDLAVSMFVVGRIAGWVAQVLEQHSDNVLIRPLLQYVGPRGLKLPDDLT